eukprot:SAG11_NODE_199_length_12635_cov_104.801771_2_plen_1022_part_00
MFVVDNDAIAAAAAADNDCDEHRYDHAGDSDRREHEREQYSEGPHEEDATANSDAEGGDEHQEEQTEHGDEDECGDEVEEDDYDEDEEGSIDDDDSELEFVVNGTRGTGVGGGCESGEEDYVDEDDEPMSFHPPHVRPSLFSGGPLTCAFGLFADQPVPEGLLPCPEELSHLTYKITQVGYKAVKNAFKSGGFRGLVKGKEYNMLWGKMGSSQMKNIKSYQRVNHFPGTWQLGRKDNLSRNIGRQVRRCAKLAANHPMCFHMPEDRAALVAEFDRMPSPVFIVKPCASSRGRGIRLITSKAQIPSTKKNLVQRYIANPLLVDGYKLDIRVYVVVTSFDPLRIYIYEDGLVRFATQKYSKKNFKKKFAHITNYSINKGRAQFVETSSESQGSKWSLQAFRKWLRDVHGADDTAVWDSMRDTCIRTVLACEDRIYTIGRESNQSCYEVWGFDLMLDDQLKPWVIEVNTSPSLSVAGAGMDKRIKQQMLIDLLNVVGVKPVNRDALRRKASAEAATQPPCKPTSNPFIHTAKSSLGEGAQSGFEMGRRNARRRVVIAAAATLTRKSAEGLLDNLSPAELEMLRCVEDEFHRADVDTIGLKLAYPTAQNVRLYQPLFETFRYANTILLSWLISSRRAKHGLDALQHGFVSRSGARAAKQASLAPNYQSAGRRMVERQRVTNSVTAARRPTSSGSSSTAARLLAATERRKANVAKAKTESHAVVARSKQASLRTKPRSARAATASSGTLIVPPSRNEELTTPEQSCGWREPRAQRPLSVAVKSSSKRSSPSSTPSTPSPTPLPITPARRAPRSQLQTAQQLANFPVARMAVHDQEREQQRRATSDEWQVTAGVDRLTAEWMERGSTVGGCGGRRENYPLERPLFASTSMGNAAVRRTLENMISGAGTGQTVLATATAAERPTATETTSAPWRVSESGAGRRRSGNGPGNGGAAAAVLSRGFRMASAGAKNPLSAKKGYENVAFVRSAPVAQQRTNRVNGTGARLFDVTSSSKHFQFAGSQEYSRML